MKYIYPYYNKYMSTNLSKKVIQQKDSFSEEKKKKINWEGLKSVTSMYDFSEHFSARIYGFSSAQEYYKEGSSVNFLRNIRIPTCCVNSIDDPLVPKVLIPFNEFESNENLLLITTKTGGIIFIFNFK
jgi:predicted alpha/beta-fold hydrolase